MKLREVYDEVSTAVDDKLISDATGRNALYKIHISLGKIVNVLIEKVSGSRKSSAAIEEQTILADESSAETVLEKAEMTKVEEEEEEGTILPDATRADGDSLVEELLSDDDVEMSGM